MTRRAGNPYEGLVSDGRLATLPTSGVVAQRLAGHVDGEPVCVELVQAAASSVRVVQRTRLFSPFPPGVSLGFTLFPRGQSRIGAGEGRDRFAASFSVKRDAWASFAASGIDRRTMDAVLAFLDSHGGVLTIGPDLVDWRAPGLDVPGQGEPLVRDFVRMAGAVRAALRRGPLGDRVLSAVDLAYLARRADAPVPTMYVSERNLAWVYGALLACGLALVAGGFYAGPGKNRMNLLLFAAFPLLAGVVGGVLLTWHLLSVRPALLP